MILICCEEEEGWMRGMRRWRWFSRWLGSWSLYFSWEVWRAYWAHGELHAVDGLVKNSRNALGYREMSTDRHREDFEMHSVGVRETNQFQNIPITHLKSQSSPSHKDQTLHERIHIHIAIDIHINTLSDDYSSWITNFLLPPSPKELSSATLT